MAYQVFQGQMKTKIHVMERFLKERSKTFGDSWRTKTALHHLPLSMQAMPTDCKLITRRYVSSFTRASQFLAVSKTNANKNWLQMHTGDCKTNTWLPSVGCKRLFFVSVCALHRQKPSIFWSRRIGCQWRQRMSPTSHGLSLTDHLLINPYAVLKPNNTSSNRYSSVSNKEHRLPSNSEEGQQRRLNSSLLLSNNVAKRKNSI